MPIIYKYENEYRYRYSLVYCPALVSNENIIEIDVSSVKRTVILEFKKKAENAYWVVNGTCMYTGQ